MKGWLNKYDDSIIAQGGETIPLSREDYLRQQHQDYLKSQAEKGRKAVVEGREKFAKDYVIPAIKTAGSFTPAGPLIGLADAYEAYQQGNTGWAIVGAGLEALPYVGKGIGKGVKALSNTLIDNKDAIKLAYYNKAPWTWKPNPNYYYRAGKGSEFLDDVIERNEIRAFNPNSYVYLRDQGLINGIRDVNTGKITLKAKTFPIADTYWSKGVPLDGRYANQNYGDHIIEASDDIPFVNSVNQRTKQKGFWDSPDVNYNSTHVRGSYVKPRQSYGYNEKGEIQPSIGTPLLYDANKMKLYKPHWLKGYKEIPKKEQGGTIPKAQGGTTLERPYIAKQDATKVLLPLTKKVNQEEIEYYNPPIEKGITSGDKRLDFLYNNQWLFDVPIVNDYIRKNAKELASISALGMVDDVEEFKELAKKNDLSYSGHGPGKGLISQYFDQDAFPPSKYKPTSDYLTFLPSYSLKSDFESNFTKAQRDDYVSSFIKEGLTSKNDVIATEIPYNEFIENKKPVYNRYPNANLVSLGNPDLGGHKMGAAWDYTVDLPYVSISDAWDFEPVHYTKSWAAYESEPERQKRRIQSTLLHKAGHPFKIYDRFYFDPKTKEYISDDSIQSLKHKKGITPLEDEFLNKDISKYFTDEQSLSKFAEGGNVSYTPEYIEQLKQFENIPDNLAYHLDNKKIPTIGWGHRITEEELKRKAIKMGKEWVPYEKFSGKEGRQYADRLMELDVAHHYNRLERQVGRDTLATLPPEVQDVLLDITYNRGSLGDSLEYVKSGDIAGLRDYLAETSKGLKGGAKTRMEWRANRIPVKTLPPVETPINYNTEDQYVPEVLQSIAEQPSTQSIIPIQDNEGYRNQENYGKPVQIVSNRPTTSISMDQVPFPILAMSDTGELKIMMPGEEHTFEGGSVTEFPIAQEGDIIKSKQLRTFTEDNGWLNKYKEL